MGVHEPQLQVHLFICTNMRSQGASCGAQGSLLLREELKKRCNEALGADAPRARINASGCLGSCQKGIVGVCYPEAKWFFELKNESKTIENMVQFVRDSIQGKH